MIPIPKYRTGNWYIARGYVDENGKPLSATDLQRLQKALGQADNRISKVKDDEGRNRLSLPVININGKIFKPADDAYDRIMRLNSRGGGRDRRYNTQKHGNLYRPVDCNSKQPLAGWMTEQQYNEWMLSHGHKN